MESQQKFDFFSYDIYTPKRVNKTTIMQVLKKEEKCGTRH